MGTASNETQQKILVVDDEIDVTELLSYHLRQKGFAVRTLNDPLSALSMVESFRPDLIILDIMMPGLSGLQVCQMIRSRSEFASVPVLFLSAKAAPADRIEGLERGADDYVCKPFSPKELILRVVAILKRVGEPSTKQTVYMVDGIRLDEERHEVYVNDRIVDLTATEFKLLLLLMQEQGKVQTRENLLSRVWNYENEIETRTVDTHMRRLREKLSEQASWLETVRGVGYRMLASR